MARKKESTVKKFEVTCVRCRTTKMWTQKTYDKHMWKVHGIANEIKVGADPRDVPRLFA